jgi:hypothetical protein
LKGFILVGISKAISGRFDEDFIIHIITQCVFIQAVIWWKFVSDAICLHCKYYLKTFEWDVSRY